jgi:hypothetical protein
MANASDIGLKMASVGREILMSMILMTRPWDSGYLDYMGTRFLPVNLSPYIYILKSVKQLFQKKKVPVIIFTAFSFVFGRCVQAF